MDSLVQKLEPNQRQGIKPRCHWLTHGAPEQAASRLNPLAEPWDSVFPDDHWMTEGFHRVEEAQLHRAPRLLPPQRCDALNQSQGGMCI